MKKDEYFEIAQKHLPGLSFQDASDQSFIPTLARDEARIKKIREAVSSVKTTHEITHGDSRDISQIQSSSIHLVVTSPPYWTLKKYPDNELQLGAIDDYDNFVQNLEQVWKECFRVLVPGGRAVIVVGDVCLSRRKFGRHVVFPLHSSIQESCRRVGLDNLTPIIWNKITNAKYEANGSGFLGKPYEPNAIIKNDVEYVLMERKPGGYRKPSLGMRILSTISAEEHKEYFQAIWKITGASTRNHPAPFPVALATRLVKMFSFVGDTVLDPFSGSGTTTIAASNTGRNSIGIEIEADYIDYARKRFLKESGSMDRSSKKLKVNHTNV